MQMQLKMLIKRGDWKMKKIIFMLLTAFVALTSCKENELEMGLPRVSFIDTELSIPKGVYREVKLILELAPTEDLKIPVTFVGDVIEGEDYVVTEKAFNFKAGEKESLLRINVPATITEGKEMVLEINEIPVGYRSGRFIKTKIITTTETTTIFSFTLPVGDLYAKSAPFEVNLTTMTGSSYNVPVETYIAIKTESNSTAIEGVHYRFLDEKNYVTILKNKNKGNVSIEILKYEAGKNQIVLSCGETSGYFEGTNAQTLITIHPLLEEQIIGEWVGLDFYNLESMLEGYWGISEEQKAMIPVPTPADRLKFKTDGTMEVNLTSKLKNYFMPCNWSVLDETFTLILGGRPAVKIQTPVVELSKANYNFNPTNENIRSVKISAYITSSNEHAEILFITLSYDGYTNPFASYGHSESGLDFIFEDLKFRFIRK